MKSLEFNILDNKYLEVVDCVWWLKRIDAIYITKSAMEKNRFAICVQQSGETIELYFRTTDEIKITKEFNNLCNAIMQVNTNFDKADISALINYANVTNIKFEKGLLSSKIIIKFDNYELVKRCATKAMYNQMQQTLESKKENNILAQ